MKFKLIFLNFYMLQIVSRFAISSSFMIEDEINYKMFSFNRFNKTTDDEYKRNINVMKLNQIINKLPIIFKNEIFRYTDDTLKINASENILMNSSYLNDSNKTQIEKSNRFWYDLFICIFCTLMILATLIGNTLVILAVLIVKKLHTKDNANNYLIVSLAISDLLVGILVLPLALHVEIELDNKYVIFFEYHFSSEINYS